MLAMYLIIIKANKSYYSLYFIFTKIVFCNKIIIIIKEKPRKYRRIRYTLWSKISSKIYTNMFIVMNLQTEDDSFDVFHHYYGMLRI